jgi:hypothetical protein
MTVTVQPDSREATAERLLTSSARHTLDPQVEVDWSAPLDPLQFAMPEQRISLYGTPLYESLTPAQRAALSRHEVASMASVGIWFEMILMQMFLRDIYDQDPTSAHVRYALTEIADECRHSQMFAQMADYLGCPAYGPGLVGKALGRIAKTLFTGSEIFAATLVAEEVLDTLQREAMKDDSLVPVVAQVSRVHVVEEARHVRYAREELARRIEGTPRAWLAWQKLSTAIAAHVIVTRLINPRAYAAVGLDPKQARRAAARNPHRRDTLRWSGERLTSYLESVGFIAGPARGIWRRAGLVA